MSHTASYGLSAAAVLLALGWLAVQLRSGGTRVRSVFAETGWTLGVMAGAAVAGWGVLTALASWLHLGETTNNDAVFLTVLSVFGACAFAVLAFRTSRRSLRAAVAGQLPVLIGLTIASAILFQDISYLFSLPLLGLLLAAVLERYRIGRLPASAAATAGIVFLYTPVCWLLYVLFLLPFAPAAIALSVIPLSAAAALTAGWRNGS